MRATDDRLDRVVARLTAAGCVAAEEEAAELLESDPDDGTLERCLARREDGEPLPWIIGWMRFCGRRIGVDPGVYVPRLQSEELARRAAALLLPGGRAVDLCTGAGAIAVHLATSVPGASVIGVDVDRAAARCAQRNGVHVVVGGIDAPLRSAAFDLVTAVAPYVPTAELRLLPPDVQRYEPARALDGGDDGLDLVRAVVASAARVLRPGGWLLTEIGGDQDAAVTPTLQDHGFGDVGCWHDEDGDLRGIAARLVTRLQP